MQSYAEKRAYLEKAIEFFSNPNKSQREKWVIKTLLSNINIKFNDDDIIAVDDDPPDIKFLNANFEVKEILDDGRKRHKEYKDQYTILLNHPDCYNKKDNFSTFTPKDITIEDLSKLILEKIEPLKSNENYKEKMGNIDIVFYLNLKDIMYIVEDPEFKINKDIFRNSFRSIMCVNGNQVIIIYAENSAPTFIKNNLGKIISADAQ